MQHRADFAEWETEEMVFALAKDGVGVETIAARCGITLVSVAEILADFLRTSDP